MKSLQPLTDKTAIGLSFLCVIHCLAIPLLIIAVPSIAALQLDNEAFHIWMVIAVLPTSIYALLAGCKQHKNYYLLWVGLTGLSCLLAALIFGEFFLGEAGEKVLTTIGAFIIAYGHFKNYRYCQEAKDCNCSTVNDNN